jgi:hypothetical protein
MPAFPHQAVCCGKVALCAFLCLAESRLNQAAMYEKAAQRVGGWCGCWSAIKAQKSACYHIIGRVWNLEEKTVSHEQHLQWNVNHEAA